MEFTMTYVQYSPIRVKPKFPCGQQSVKQLSSLKKSLKARKKATT